MTETTEPHADPAPLRTALILAGMALLQEGGMPALTLRRAAARAGVSHAAPAHHFNGLPGLLTAIAARAFHLFCTAMEEARDHATTPFDRLQAICQGYLAFAAAHQGLFHVMFVSPEVLRADPDLTWHANRAYLILRDGCLPFAAQGADADEALETTVWSMVHGYAVLGFQTKARLPGPIAHPPDFATLLSELLAHRAVTRNPLAPPAKLR